MNHNTYAIDTLSHERLKQLIRSRSSFVLDGIPRLSFPDVVEKVEETIESAGYRCRIYTKGRCAALAGLAVETLGTGALAASAAMLAHNLVTWDPDFEIAKNYFTGTLTVIYKR